MENVIDKKGIAEKIFSLQNEIDITSAISSNFGDYIVPEGAKYLEKYGRFKELIDEDIVLWSLPIKEKNLVLSGDFCLKWLKMSNKDIFKEELNRKLADKELEIRQILEEISNYK